MTYVLTLKNCIEKLRQAGIDDPESDARIILTEASGMDYAHLMAEMRSEVSEDTSRKIKKFMEKRLKRIPLQQITGYTEFMGLKFSVDENVLCPRQDTEVLVEQVLDAADKNSRVLDMCTGSGCIAVSIAKLKKADTTACDISEKAIAIAEKNARDNGVSVHFFKGDLFEALPDHEKYDIVVSNPPYIKSDVIGTLEPEVKDHEPRIALDGAEDGLFFYRRIIMDAPDYLRKNGLIFFETGYDQAEQVKKLLLDRGFSDIKITKDYGGNDRVVAGVFK
ncbi:MAG: peptide chain release factor N(5)-glutamine methyltransferase [bacterium LCO1.1]|uniref:Release factor glutamine methyltransferase n=1 Tax=Candidatus Weimeria bifida TaxID=2599074 RepID=A0A6N7IZB3_9FIRM|nr:peptide chain release factor N(5)-glutamine methyltransferase [Candidatus Weimeria bifida]